MQEFIESESELLVLGTNEEENSNGDEQFKIISKAKINSKILEKLEEFPVPIITQAGKYFYSLLKEKQEEFKCIQVDYNIQMTEAFTTEEIIEIMFLSGYFNEVKSCTISEYNPRLEDIINGMFCAEIFYYFTLGVELRERNSSEKFVNPSPKITNIFTDVFS